MRQLAIILFFIIVYTLDYLNHDDVMEDIDWNV